MKRAKVKTKANSESKYKNLAIRSQFNLTPNQQRFRRILGYLSLIPAVWFSVTYVIFDLELYILVPVFILYFYGTLGLIQARFKFGFYLPLQARVYDGADGILNNLFDRKRFYYTFFLAIFNAVGFVILTILFDIILNIDLGL